MAQEYYANGPVTTVNTGVTSTGTSLVVTSATGFPASGNFHIKIDSELLLVTGVSGTTWTVTRGVEGSTATIHQVGAQVYLPLTVDSLEALLVEMHGGTVVQSRRRLNFVDTASLVWTLTDDSTNKKMDISAVASGGGGGGTGFEATFTVPALSGYTWVNQGTATATDADGQGIMMTAPAASQNNLRLLAKSTGSEPWTWVAKIVGNAISAGNANFGVFVRDSGSGALQIMRLINGTLDMHAFNSPTSYNTGILSAITPNPSTPFTWFKIDSDGTHRTWYISIDGTHWMQILQTAHNFGFVGNSVGFYIEGASSGYDTLVKLVSAT